MSGNVLADQLAEYETTKSGIQTPGHPARCTKEGHMAGHTHLLVVEQLVSIARVSR